MFLSQFLNTFCTIPYIPTYITKAVEARYEIRQISAVCAILELVFIRSGCLEFGDTSNGTCISACEIDAFIQFLCAS